MCEFGSVDEPSAHYSVVQCSFSLFCTVYMCLVCLSIQTLVQERTEQSVGNFCSPLESRFILANVLFSTF